MRVTRFATLLLSIALVTPVFAGSPQKVKEWDKSPEAYFMTEAEHREWRGISSPEQAQQFIDKFVAKRGPNFTADIADRAAQADKYLTLSKLPGSQTLRGKVVILLGPPTNLDVTKVVDNSAIHHDSPAVAGAYTGGSANNVDEDTTGHEGASSMGAGKLIRNYHFTYASTPTGPLDVTISADDISGKDRPRGRDDSKRLDAVFEAAAQASIKTK
jgi:GWxTD domain-containing protein